MWSKSASEKGCEELRHRAIEEYYKNPNICLECNKIINVPDGVKVYVVRQKKFCDRTCAAKYNNKKFPKRRKSKQSITNSQFSACKSCGAVIENPKKNNGTYRTINYCEPCRNDIRRENGKKAAITRTGFSIDPTTYTKKDALDRFGSSWAMKSFITANARRVYRKSKKLKSCVCGYSKHIDVCHIKAISDFPDTATISEINSEDNLIGLCKNHHWEFDHGTLDEDITMRIQRIA